MNLQEVMAKNIEGFEELWKAPNNTFQDLESHLLQSQLRIIEAVREWGEEIKAATDRNEYDNEVYLVMEDLIAFIDEGLSEGR